ncbi:hypothetical protein Tco_0392872 [Tanacetum coccineum]
MLELSRHALSVEVDMTYWSFLGAGTMFVTFQNVLRVYLLRYSAQIRRIFLMDMAYFNVRFVAPTKKDWDILFQLMFDEYFNPPPSVASPVPVVVALIKPFHLL